jgi:hypothetical protein
MSRGRSRATTGPTAAALLASLLLAGCSGTAGFEGPDPLTGGPPIQKRTSPAPSLLAGLSSSPPATPAATPTGQLPPVPVPSTATSQAALAGGAAQPLDTSRDLRIGTPTALASDQPLWRGSTDPSVPPAPVAPSAPFAPATARLSDPLPANGVAPVNAVAPPANPGAPTAPAIVVPVAGSRVDTLDQALRQLQTGRSVSWQRLETVDAGGWRFRCAVANPSKPDVDFNYDASGATELDAVRQVLNQIALDKH